MNRTMFLAIAALSLSACSYNRPGIIAPMSLGPQEHPIAIVQGEAITGYFFGVNVGGEDTYASAIDNAKLKAGVHDATMANVFADKEVFCFPACFLPIYRSVKTTLYGTLITYESLPVKAHKPNADGVM